MEILNQSTSIDKSCIANTVYMLFSEFRNMSQCLWEVLKLFENSV